MPRHRQTQDDQDQLNVRVARELLMDTFSAFPARGIKSKQDTAEEALAMWVYALGDLLAEFVREHSRNTFRSKRTMAVSFKKWLDERLTAAPGTRYRPPGRPEDIATIQKTSIDLPGHLFAELKEASSSHGVNQTTAIRDAIAEWVTKNKQAPSDIKQRLISGETRLNALKMDIDTVLVLLRNAEAALETVSARLTPGTHKVDAEVAASRPPEQSSDRPEDAPLPEGLTSEGGASDLDRDRELAARALRTAEIARRDLADSERIESGGDQAEDGDPKSREQAG